MRYFPILRYLFILSVILCTACGTALPTIKPYKLDVQQGNVVTSKMLLQLRPGMTKSQVRFIMGTPLLQDSFHGNRWDYVYQLRENGKIIEQRRVILDFENELLKSVRGDVVPTGSDKAKAPEDAANTGTRVVEPTKTEEKGMLDKLKFWEKRKAKKEADKAKAEERAAPVAAPTELTSPQSGSTQSTSPESGSPEGTQSAPEAKSGDSQKSILAVPMEAAPAQASPSVAPTESAPARTDPVEAPPVEATPTSEPVSQPAPAESQTVTPVEAPASRAAPAPESLSEPASMPAYEPTSGMLFDRNLKSAPPEEVAPEVKAAPPAPRAGNKTPPPPKDLPPEGSPSFFDRMLEKIGF